MKYSVKQINMVRLQKETYNVLVLPSMKVMGSMRGFLDLVAWSSSHEGGWLREPLTKVRWRRWSQ